MESKGRSERPYHVYALKILLTAVLVPIYLLMSVIFKQKSCTSLIGSLCVGMPYSDALYS